MWNRNIYSEGVYEQIVDVDDQECKFRKIGDDNSFGDCGVMQALESYQDTIEKCECMNDNIFQLQKLNSLAQIIRSPPAINNEHLQQPSKPQLKFKISIQKKPKVPTTQSSQQTILIQKEYPSELKINIHRASIQSSDKIKSNLSLNDQKEIMTCTQNYTQSNQYTLSTNQIQEEKATANSNLPKNLRMKSSSILTLSSNAKQQKKSKKCIPLKQFRIKQKESFLQTAYRMRRFEQPHWSKNWASSDQLKKSNAKMTLKPNDKIMFETYDFDGELIPSFYALQKQKKMAGEIPKVNFLFVNNIPLQNKRKDINRNQTKVKTINQAKYFQYTDLIPVQSQFLKNFTDLRWGHNIEQIDIQQNENKKRFSQFGNAQGKRKLQQQEWVSDFQKIKHSGSHKNSTSSNFQHSFSKYLKAKTLHERQSKQKTRSLHDGKHLGMLLQNQKEKEPSINQPIRVLKKGPQKVRVNKTLFKRILGISLKDMDPQCREDIATIKLINSTEKQNIKVSEGQNHKNLKSTRNTDPILYQEEYQLTHIMGQTIGDSKTDFSKSLNQSQQLIKKDSTKQMADTCSNVSLRKKYFANEIKSFLNAKSEKKEWQKIFKKETKKVIFKQSLNAGHRQSFI